MRLINSLPGKKLVLVAALVVACGLAVAQNPVQTEILRVNGRLPTGATVPNAATIGVPGAAVYTYFVVAHYPIGDVTSVGVSVNNAPGTLSVSNYVQVGWTAAPNATGYDVVRQTGFVSGLPSSCTSCVVTVNTHSTSFSDQGGATTNYTAVGFSPSNPNVVFRLNTELYNTPQLEMTNYPLRIMNGNLCLGTGTCNGNSGTGTGAVLHGVSLITGTLDNGVLGFTDNASAINYFQITNGATGTSPTLGIATTTDSTANINVAPKGGSFLVQPTGINSAATFAVLPTSNAVNGVQIAPGATGSGPLITPTLATADANAGVTIASNGTGSIQIATNAGGRTQFEVLSTSGTIINHLTVTGNTTGLFPTIGIGTTTDANVGINITPKGAGIVTVTNPSIPQTTTTNPYTAFTTLSPPNAIATNATTQTAGGIFWSQLYIPSSTTLTGACVLNGGTVGTDKYIFGLYNTTGTLVANTLLTGTNTANASKYQCIAFTGTIAVTGPQTYYIAVQGNSTHDNFQTYAANSAPTNYGTGTQAGAFGTLASITPSVTFNANQGPLMLVY